MKEFRCSYGKEYKTFEIDDRNLMGELLPNQVQVDSVGEEEVKRAIQNPIGSKRLKDIVKRGQKAVIITSDITRPMPSKFVVPHVIQEMLEGGLSYDDITVVLAVGSHRPHTEEEKKYLIGEESYSKVKCVDSSPGEFVHMGATKSGTPVDIFKTVAEADVRVCLGNIEYHWFAGYSGGAKAIMPGVSTRAAIQRNHRFLVRDEARTGDMDNNPVRQDIEEVANFVNIDFIVNVVLDEKKNIIKAVAGHHVLAHREGCSFLDKFYKIEIEQEADIVIVSAGGFPKDLNLYQAQKALDNAKHAVRKGGIIIWVGRCQEGLGERVFEEWILNAKDPQSILDRIQTDFMLGGHKAAAIAGVLVKCQLFLVSELEQGLVEKIFMKPFDEISEALKEAFKQLGSDAKVIYMPVGGSTLPVISKK